MNIFSINKINILDVFSETKLNDGKWSGTNKSDTIYHHQKQKGEKNIINKLTTVHEPNEQIFHSQVVIQLLKLQTPLTTGGRKHRLTLAIIIIYIW